MKKPPGMRAVLKFDGQSTASAITAASAAAISTVPAAVSAPAALSFFARTCFIHRQRTALKVFLVKHCDGLGGFILGTHFHKSEAAGTARSSVLHDIGGNHHSGCRKMILQIILGGIEGKISNK